MVRIRVTGKAISVGYEKLVSLFELKVMPHYRNSFILEHGSAYIERDNLKENHYYPKKYFPKDIQNPLNHLEFALKYDGLNLEILYELFNKIDSREIVAYVKTHPTSKLARKIWYLYEFLTKNVLDLKNAEGGSYALLLHPEEYYTGFIVRSRRHYVDDNLLGNYFFCPIIRRTKKLITFEKKDLSNTAIKIMQQFDPAIISRAVNYLYLKETMSSYEIEREKPDSTRADRFIQALKRADHLVTITKEILIELQNIIVDPRFANKDYRDFQNYIGTETRLDMHRALIDFIPPKPEDVRDLMQGLLGSLERMMQEHVHPVVIAAAIAFGFVFIHPFEDGNGRLHRFLIHYIYARTGFVPKGTIFPISAVILKDMEAYNALLESYSKPLLCLINRYQLDERGSLKVQEDTAIHYRYLDYTRCIEYLFECTEKTICTDFSNELFYIVNYDRTKKALQNIVDMPDNQIHLFIRCVLQNQYRLSAKKREKFFNKLTEEEILHMEKIVKDNFINSNVSQQSH